MSAGHFDERCRCGDLVCSKYDLHGWLCDECADALGDDLLSDDEREEMGE